MHDMVQLVPNKWVTEEKLVAITGLRSGTISRARKNSWLQGREYLHVSPDGQPKANSECMYNCDAINAWIERQAQKQPDAVCVGKA
ncbi:excisionase [Chimaeribacter arupi]|uniref:excisionase family protein n=1 Tax=Yersiniaceae TaxID=1903411 RepID=UPI00093447A4|nr:MULTISPECIES: excisionase family protein [Yersiniaceae]PLR48674.1 excisionase [Chimaeribacter arupi]WKZ94052.1 excisionase family protein [Chimaeribacter arupi]